MRISDWSSDVCSSDVSGSTPAGLSNYEPDATILAEAQRLTRSFSYKPRHGRNPPRPILGLFLMGSLGTLAQADQSDMDVWVCHRPDLSDDELAELRKTCPLLERSEEHTTELQ